jgi:hypothetical protein
MRVSLGAFFLVCLGGFIVSSGIVGTPLGRDIVQADAAGLNASMPVLLALSGPVLIVACGVGASALARRIGWLPVCAGLMLCLAVFSLLLTGDGARWR